MRSPGSKAQASLVMGHEQTPDALGDVLGAGLSRSDDVDKVIEMRLVGSLQVIW
jgi:hypothetical protein